MSILLGFLLIVGGLIGAAIFLALVLLAEKWLMLVGVLAVLVGGAALIGASVTGHPEPQWAQVCALSGCALVFFGSIGLIDD